jgi:hypothetical protein
LLKLTIGNFNESFIFQGIAMSCSNSKVAGMPRENLEEEVVEDGNPFLKYKPLETDS